MTEDDKAVEVVPESIRNAVYRAWARDYGTTGEMCDAIARAAIAAYKAHLEAEGMVVVPVESVKGHRFAPHKGRSVCLDCGEYDDEAGPACFESYKPYAHIKQEQADEPA